ncbi:PREDICTED: calcitonin gene-related peptide type 1 receptor-like, partial [Priapulus caudatus]|uniref:Calcitonin gene-related peptide type 1 receptor-like n=1 Tax=Priapulus caudatus TaxID=37621 RepID=A0ABM1F6N5_PRICU
QLQCHRITLHKNLFFSFVCSGVTIIAYETVIMHDTITSPDPIKDRNKAGCKIIMILSKYFRITNYMWMFCEGYYLHKLIASAFHEQKNLVVFYLIGW